MSLDGYIGTDGRRLLLSNAADLDRVDAERARSDAVLVGAATVRNDDPRLVVREQTRRDDRVAGGRAPSPVKVTVTGRARLDPAAQLFAPVDADVLVYCASSAVAGARDRLGRVATVVDGGEPVSMPALGEDLSARGIGRLLVEGGESIHTQFLTADLVDELQLVVAPCFVGDSRARRFVGDGGFRWDADRRATLAEVRQIGDVALLRYALSSRFPG